MASERSGLFSRAAGQTDVEGGVGLCGVVGTCLGDGARLRVQQLLDRVGQLAGVPRATAKGFALDGRTQLDEVTKLRPMAAQPIVDEALAGPLVAWIDHKAALADVRFEVAQQFQAAQALTQHRARDAQLVCQVSLRRQALALTELPNLDPRADLRCDLFHEAAAARFDA